MDNKNETQANFNNMRLFGVSQDELISIVITPCRKLTSNLYLSLLHPTLVTIALRLLFLT